MSRNNQMLLSVCLILTLALQGCSGNTNNDVTEIPDTVEETTLEETAQSLVSGTYTNGDNSIIIAENDSNQYNFNFNVFDDTGDDRFLAGSITETDGVFIGTIENDMSERYIEKQFSITPNKDNILISSDDDSLLFLCMQYKYSSEVDALEEDISDLEENDIFHSDIKQGNLDYKLTQGYYGFWDGDTEYTFGANPNGTFVIDIVGASAPVLYAEGDIEDNGDSTYNCKITSSDTDFMKGQSIIVSVLSEDTISIAGSFKMLDDIVHGTYQYAGASAADVEKLKSNGNGATSTNTDLDLTDEYLQENDIFTESDYELIEKIPSVDFYSDYIGHTFDEFLDETGYYMEPFTNEYLKQVGYGINKKQTDHLDFYYARFAKDSREIVGIKDDIVVIHGKILEGFDLEPIVNTGISPLQFSTRYSDTQTTSDSVNSSIWKLNNCYMQVNAQYSNIQGYSGTNMTFPVVFVSDIHYLSAIHYGMPIGVVLGGD